MINCELEELVINCEPEELLTNCELTIFALTKAFIRKFQITRPTPTEEI